MKINLRFVCQILSFSLSALFVSCSTGVVPMGRDTYMISGSSPGLINSATVRAKLLREADAWCRQRGLIMLPLNFGGVDAVLGQKMANAEVTFRAVRPGDPEDRRVNYERAVDRHEVIEIRNR